MNRRLAIALSVAVLGPGVPARAAEPVEPAGKAVFQKWCAPCHAPGPNHPGTTALDVLYAGARPGALEQRTDLTASTVQRAVRQGAFSMPFFRKTEVSDADLEAIVNYLVKSHR